MLLELLVISVCVTQVYYKQRDYWPFVWCIRYISPHLASHVEQVCSSPLIRLSLTMGKTVASTFYKPHSIALNDNLKNTIKHISDTALAIIIHM